MWIVGQLSILFKHVPKTMYEKQQKHSKNRVFVDDLNIVSFINS